jgi:hypothetical protein
MELIFGRMFNLFKRIYKLFILIVGMYLLREIIHKIITHTIILWMDNGGLNLMEWTHIYHNGVMDYKDLNRVIIQ